MSDRYKQVKLYDDFKFIPNCPIDVLKGAIYIDNTTNKAVFQLKFVNMQTKNIKALYIQIKGSNDLGEILEDKEYQYLDLNVIKGQEFGTEQLKELGNNTIRNINITINKIIYADNEVWENKNAISYDRINLQKINDDLLYIATRKVKETGIELDNIYYPTKNENYWTCICGTYNSNNNEKCYKCRCSKETILENFSKEALERDLINYKKNKEQQQEKLNNSIKSFLKVLKKVAILSVIIVSLILIIIFVKKEFDYQSAKKEFMNKNYELAISKFDKLNEYKDSKSFIEKAEECINNQKVENISESIKKVSTSASISSYYEYDYLYKAYKGHIIGIKNDGTIIASGNNDYGQCNIQDWNDVIQVSAGENFSVGLKADGTVVAVGDNEYKQCEVESWKDIIQISANTHYCIGLKKDGTVVKAGKYSDDIDTSDWKDIVSISAGKYLCAGLKADGTIIYSGSDMYDIENINKYNNILQVSAGSCIVGLKNDGTVVREGFNYKFGEQKEDSWSDIIQVSNGEYFSIGLKADGTVVATGKNENGECNVKDWKNIIYVYAGDGFSIGIKSDGTIVSNGIINLGNEWKDLKI